MNKLLEKLSPELQKKLKRKKMPTFEQVMLATLTKDYFSDKEWIFERKLDGVRCLLFKNKTKAFLKSRNDNSLSDTYPELVEATKKLKVDQIILDGEIITFKGNVSSFEKLQPRIGVKNPSKELIKKVKIYLYVFDILYLDGYDLTKLPLITRKNLLKQAIAFKGPLRYVIYKNEKGLGFFKQACKKGWEGIIAKERNSSYVHRRSPHWLKFKCIVEQELVVGGYTEPQGSRIGFGSLLLGYYDKNKLIYVGKVGTGFSDEFLKKFSAKLKKIETKKNPFSNAKDVQEKQVHFVRPKLVVEIGFEEWTKDNKLRQPRLLGIRTDKDPKKVVKETPKNIIPTHQKK